MKSLAKLYYSFFNQILPAFIEQHVPPSAELPYLTYTLPLDDFGMQSIQQIRIWTRNQSFQELNQYCEQLALAVPNQGTALFLEHNQGAIYLYRGSPFMQITPMDEPDLKVAYINIIVKSFIY